MSASSELASYREKADVTQSTMAMAMGLPLRTYEDIEAGRSSVRPIHVVASKLALMRLAIARSDPALLAADPEVEALVRDCAALLANKKPT